MTTTDDDGAPAAQPKQTEDHPRLVMAKAHGRFIHAARHVAEMHVRGVLKPRDLDRLVEAWRALVTAEDAEGLPAPPVDDEAAARGEGSSS